MVIKSVTPVLSGAVIYRTEQSCPVCSVLLCLVSGGFSFHFSFLWLCPCFGGSFVLLLSLGDFRGLSQEMLFSSQPHGGV